MHYPGTQSARQYHAWCAAQVLNQWQAGQHHGRRVNQASNQWQAHQNHEQLPATDKHINATHGVLLLHVYRKIRTYAYADARQARKTATRPGQALPKPVRANLGLLGPCFIPPYPFPLSQTPPVAHQKGCRSFLPHRLDHLRQYNINSVAVVFVLLRKLYCSISIRQIYK